MNVPIGLTFPEELNKNFVTVFFNIGKHTNWISQTLLDLRTETTTEKIRKNDQRNHAIKVHKTLKNVLLFIFLIFLM